MTTANNKKSFIPTKRMEFTGERFVPEIHGNIELEHLHRYMLAYEIATDKIVLDIACGEGYGSAKLAERAKKVYGVDISNDTIKYAIGRYKKQNLSFKIGSCSNIPLPDKSIDLVVSFETIEHHDQHEEMMKEIKRILRPGGVLIISSPDKLNYTDKPKYKNPFHIKELYKADFEKLINKYFKNSAFYGQRVLFGSNILSDSLQTQSKIYQQNNNQIYDYQGLPSPIYWIAIASDDKVPILPSGVFEQPIGKSEVVQTWMQIVADRENSLNVVQSQLNSVTNQLVSLQSQFIDLQEKLRTVSEELKKKTNLLNEIINSKKWKAANIFNRFLPFFVKKLIIHVWRIIWKSAKILVLTYRRYRDVYLIYQSGLFDKKWYLKTYPDVAKAKVSPILHYYALGAFEGRNPSLKFDSDWYLKQNSNVAVVRMNPLVHYLRFGQGNKELKNDDLPSLKPVDIGDSNTSKNLLAAPWDIDYPSFTKQEKNKWLKREQKLRKKPLLSVILVAPNDVPSHFLRDAIHSVTEQSYPNWQLCIGLDNKSIWSEESINERLQEFGGKIKIVPLSNPEVNIPTINKILPSVNGDFFISLDPCDMLHPTTLFTIAEHVNSHPSPDLLYDIAERHDYKLQSVDKMEVKNGIKNKFSWAQLVVFRTSMAKTMKLFDHGNLILFERGLQKILSKNNVEEIKTKLYFKRQIPNSHFFIINKRILRIASTYLHVCIDARLINRNITGTERYITELLKSLSKLRHTANLKITALTHEAPEKSIEGVKWLSGNHEHEIRSSDIFHKTFPSVDFYTLRQMALANTCIFTPLDLISYSFPSYFDNESDYSRYRSIMASSSAISDEIIAISNHSKKDIMAKLDVLGNKIRVVPLGIDYQDSDKNAYKTDLKVKRHFNLPDKYFFYIGTNYPHKNLLKLFKAFNVVKQRYPNFYLVLVGFKYYHSQQTEIDTSKKILGKNLVDLDHVEDEYIPSLYRLSCGLVYPSLYEGFGLPILEAMVNHTPVIASNTTSIPEVAGHGNALLIDPTSENALAQAMIKLIENPILRQSLINNGNKWVKQFTWENTAKQTIQTYLETVSSVLKNENSQRLNNKLMTIENDIAKIPTILIVTHVRFYPPAAGNELRLFKLIRYLKKQGYRIVVLMNPFLEKEPIDQLQLLKIHSWVDHYEELNLQRISPTKQNWQKIIGVEPELKSLQNFELSFCPDAMLDRASELINIYNPQIIIAEYIWTSRIFNVAKKDTLKIIDLHDMFSRKKEGVVKHGIDDALSITSKQEKTFINRANLIIAIQENEAEALRALKPNCKVITTGVDIDNINKKTVVKNNKQIILVVASDNQLNQKCVKEFITEIWPSIKKELPEAILQIAGKICQSIHIKDDSSIKLLNYVKDIDNVYSQAMVVVNPIYAGTGLKIKSVEAIGHGEPLIAYEEGVAGLSRSSNDPFLIAKTKKGMINAVVRVIKDRQLRNKLVKNAISYSKLHFSEEEVYNELTNEISKKILPPKKLRVLCLFVRYSVHTYPLALNKLEEWYKKLLPGYQCDVWIIDNKLFSSFDGIDIESGHRLMGGDNSLREFSAWQKILTTQIKGISKYNLIHFVTEAFDTLYTEYLDKFGQSQLLHVATKPICLGHLDYYDKPIRINNIESQSWIRTCFFFMSPNTIKQLGNIISFKNEETFFDKNGKFKKNAKISANYQRNITNWLEGKKQQGISWHGKIQNKEEFVKKSLAIINEHSFSMKMRETGIKIIDVNWLYNKSYKVCSEMNNVPIEMKQINELKGRGIP